MKVWPLSSLLGGSDRWPLAGEVIWWGRGPCPCGAGERFVEAPRADCSVLVLGRGFIATTVKLVAPCKHVDCSVEGRLSVSSWRAATATRPLFVESWLVVATGESLRAELLGDVARTFAAWQLLLPNKRLLPSGGLKRLASLLG
jgi:hypothetical protein